MKAHLTTIGKTDTWITPKYITDAIGKFDLDPCAHIDMPWQHATNQFTINDNGLSQNWNGRVWLNPPFNRKYIDSWFAKMVNHGNGILLTGAAFETKRFEKFVWGKSDGILVLDHRPKFCQPCGESLGNSGQTICLIAYGTDNLESLIESNLGKVLIEVKAS